MHVIFQFTFYADFPSSVIFYQFSSLQECFKYFQPFFRFHHFHLQLKMLLAEATARRWHVASWGGKSHPIWYKEQPIGRRNPVQLVRTNLLVLLFIFFYIIYIIFCTIYIIKRIYKQEITELRFVPLYYQSLSCLHFFCIWTP